MLRAFFLTVCAASAMSLGAQDFDEPIKLKTGDTPIGHTLNDRDRLYPSPALHDIDGDGNNELVIGDLFGNLTYVSKTKDGWGEEKLLNDVDGNPLKFKNW